MSGVYIAALFIFCKIL